MSEKTERGEDRTAQGTGLPVIGATTPNCPRTTTGVAKSGCSACGKCRRSTAEEVKPGGDTNATTTKGENQG